MTRTAACLVLLAAARFAGADEPLPTARFGQTLVVETGDQPRIDAPASIEMSVGPKELRSVRLVETTGNQELAVPSQVEPGTPPRLWLIVRGTTAAKSKRSYRIDSGAAVTGQEVSVERLPDAVVMRVGKSQVLRYNSALVKPPSGIDAKYGRNAFIHPCWTPSGTVVTDQFPPDHAHQSGLFLAYTKTEFEGRTPNFWEYQDGKGQVRFKDMEGTAQGTVFGELRVRHEHVDLSASPAKVALIESWKLRVWNIGGADAGFWVCDLSSTLNCATSSPLRLLKYHYGGMALRGTRTWDAEHARFLTSDGKDRIAGNHTRPRWCDLAGPVGDRTAGITFFTHPDNFRAPEPLRIHPTMPYMVYAPAQLGDWEIAPGKPHVSRYQLVFHDGDMPAATANRLWLNFSQPLVPSVARSR